MGSGPMCSFERKHERTLVDFMTISYDQRPIWAVFRLFYLCNERATGIKLRFHLTGLGWKLYDVDLGLGEAKQFFAEPDHLLNNTEREIALWDQIMRCA
jgi:hypothetical protein